MLYQNREALYTQLHHMHRNNILLTILLIYEATILCERESVCLNPQYTRTRVQGDIHTCRTVWCIHVVKIMTEKNWTDHIRKLHGVKSYGTPHTFPLPALGTQHYCDII